MYKLLESIASCDIVMVMYRFCITSSHDEVELLVIVWCSCIGSVMQLFYAEP